MGIASAMPSAVVFGKRTAAGASATMAAPPNTHRGIAQGADAFFGCAAKASRLTPSVAAQTRNAEVKENPTSRKSGNAAALWAAQPSAGAIAQASLPLIS